MSSSVVIVPVDPLDPTRDALFAAWHSAQEATRRHDEGDLASPHTAHELRERARTEASVLITLTAALRGDTVVGTLATEASQADNTHRLDGEIDVVPACRRQGVGTALLQHLEAEARDAGRSTVTVFSTRVEGGPELAGPFLDGRGYDAVLAEAVNVLDLPDGAASLPEVLAPLDEAVAAHGSRGYSLLTFVDEIPDAHLDDRAVLAQRMSTDAPFDDLELDEEVWDAARVRERITTLRAQGRRYVETVARHDGSGVLAGFTALAVTPTMPERAHQWETLVRADHRGHRLGMAMKAEALRRLLVEEPAVRRVLTWNHPENHPMMAVNTAMGFRRAALSTVWQRRLP